MSQQPSFYEEMSEETRDLTEILSRMTAGGDRKQLEAFTYDFETRVMEKGVIPPRWFDSLLRVIRTEEYLAMEGSWLLLRIFENCWDELDGSQRARLLVALEEVFGSFRDWMSCFVISGLLGEQFCDAASLGVLLRLSRLPAEVPRSMVPHGLEHIAAEVGDPELRSRALVGITSMRSDSSERVRREVDESIKRLRARGLSPG